MKPVVLLVQYASFLQIQEYIYNNYPMFLAGSTIKYYLPTHHGSHDGDLQF